MTVAASPARLPNIPIKMIVGTMIRFEARLITEIINLSKYPDFSAAPTPIITANTSPSAGNSEKFLTASFIIIAIPSVLRILFICMVSPFPGCFTDTSKRDTIQVITAKPTHIKKKSIAGSGNLLPAFSTPFRNLLTKDVLSFVLVVIKWPPFVS